MRLPFIFGKVNAPAPDPAREHGGDGLQQMIAAELPLAAASQRRLQATRAEHAKHTRDEDRRVAAMLAAQGYEGD